MELPTFNTIKELQAFIIENKSAIMTAKKAAIKYADGVNFNPVIDSPAFVIKEDDGVNKDSVEVTAVLNTTNILDSHGDVHLPGLWKKTLQENKNILHLQEHTMKFSNIISDGADIKTVTKTFDWSELGFEYEGKTQALLFNPSVVKQSVNAFMYDRYKAGNVKQHSVGMRYVNIELAVNNEDYKTEFATWNKYIDKIANKEDAERKGYFYAVKEAKLIEGSAVVLGSNFATPTLNIKAPSTDTPKNEPSKDDTQRRKLLLKQIFN